MALFISSLNSGSNGNCYYVGSSTDAVLVDVGLSCRETEKRMKQVGLAMQTVKAIFVSHEHGDHIKGVSVLANKYNLPVYITKKTASNGPRLIGHLAKYFTSNQSIVIGNITITAFEKQHDAIDPHSFIISHNETTVGVFTDIGVACNNLKTHFAKCHAAFLEANYDDEMLETGKYPLHLKNRIRGDQGHLSNKQALELFTTQKSSGLSHLILSHLSKENNKIELVQELFNKHANGTSVIIASRYQPTEVYKICLGNDDTNKNKVLAKPVQLDLF